MSMISWKRAFLSSGEEIGQALDLHYPAEEVVPGDGEARHRRNLRARLVGQYYPTLLKVSAS